MKKILVLIIICLSVLSAQQVFKKGIKTNTISAFSTTYGTLDTGNTTSRWEFTRPTQFDSLVRFFTNFAGPNGWSYDTTRIPYLDKANAFTARQTMTSNAVDTILAKSSGNKIYLEDSVKIYGGLIAGNSFKGGRGENYDGSMSSSKYSMMFGYRDSNYSTSANNSGENFILGNNNVIGRTNPTAAYGNWLFGQYLRSENLGVWAFGADDEFLKKIIPFEGSIVFVNEEFIHWLSNPLAQDEGHSFGWQSPHVKDSVAFKFYYRKTGSADDAVANGSFDFISTRKFTATTQRISGGNTLKHFSVNEYDDNAWHFNPYNNSGRPFGKVYIDSNDLVLENGKIYLQKASTTAGDYAELVFGVSTGDIYHGSIRAVRGVAGQNGSLEFLTQKNSGSPYALLERRFKISETGQLQYYKSGTAYTFLDSTAYLTVDSLTTTGLSSFGTNAGSGTIGVGDSLQISVSGLTTATGNAVVSYKRTGATSAVVADTIASYNINENDKITLYGKFGWVVSYVIGEK